MWVYLAKKLGLSLVGLLSDTFSLSRYHRQAFVAYLPTAVIMNSLKAVVSRLETQGLPLEQRGNVELCCFWSQR